MYDKKEEIKAMCFHRTIISCNVIIRNSEHLVLKYVIIIKFVPIVKVDWEKPTW